MKGKKHGRGTYSWTDGSKYEGDWYENKIKGLEHIRGKMGGVLMVNGLIIIWMESAYIPGKMVDVTGAHIKTTKSMAMGSMYGLMVDLTQANG